MQTPKVEIQRDTDHSCNVNILKMFSRIFDSYKCFGSIINFKLRASTLFISKNKAQRQKQEV